MNRALWLTLSLAAATLACDDAPGAADGQAPAADAARTDAVMRSDTGPSPDRGPMADQGRPDQATGPDHGSRRDQGAPDGGDAPLDQGPLDQGPPDQGPLDQGPPDQGPPPDRGPGPTLRGQLHWIQGGRVLSPAPATDGTHRLTGRLRLLRDTP